MLVRTLAGLAIVLATATPARAEMRLGVMGDVGAPDGANVSLVYQPIRMARVHGGVGTNYISRGVRAGVTFVPISWYVTPTLSVDYGHYPEGDANPLARMISGDSSYSAQVLERVGYDYANAHVGLEFGRGRFNFYLRAGLTRITSELHPGEMDPDSNVRFTQDPSATIVTLSARVGFVVYLLK